MNDRAIGLTIGLGVILLVLGGMFIPRASNAPAVPMGQSGPVASTTTPVASTTGSTTGGAAAGPQQYTMAQVAQHNSGSSCWTAIDGGVYDVTAWIPQHPGGEQAILNLCGTDGSAAFNGQHGGQARPASELATFKIGVLAQ